MDLLPTLLDLATDGTPPEAIDPVDGHSLAGLLHNDDPSWKDDVMMEYTGEGVYSPCFMLRKDGFKYIYCEDDPGMLFDLNNDPEELRNLCGNEDFKHREEFMLAEILQRWDSNKIKENIIQSQNRRKFLQSVLLKGKRSSWDYEPYRDSSVEFVRSSVDTDTTMTKGLARFPYMEPITPHTPRSDSGS